ncbi:MAG: GNAT family N-acetyltransferase [Ignavibacteria bacterium]|nr:GNAT family N-acetyltransferase [Ignavibacteria bacterium]
MILKEFKTEDIDILIDILVNNPWEFHSGKGWTREMVEEEIKSGYFSSVDKKTFFLSDEKEIIGFIRIFDLGDDILDDETPLFDLRIKKEFRGKGFGKQAVDLALEFVFNTYPNKNRFEATTRHDNIAMRKVLQKCGFVKEAHYRQSWPDKNNVKVDTVGYGILRTDWENNSRTDVNWNDM